MRNLKGFKLFESYKRAKEYVEKSDNVDKDTLKKIQSISGKTPNMIYNYLLWYEQGLSVNGGDKWYDSIEQFINFYKKNRQLVKKLPNNLIDYTNFEKLSDDLTTLIGDSDIKKFVDNLYPMFKNTINLEDKDVVNKINHYIKLTDKEKESLPPQKYYKMNNLTVDDFLNDIVKYTKKENGDSKLIKEAKLKGEVVYFDNDVLVVRTYNKEFISDYGSSKWCIVYAMKSYYDSYVSPLHGYTQYIVFDLSKDDNDQFYKYGISIINGKVKYGGCQDALNQETDIQTISDKLGIPSNLFKDHKYSIDELVSYFTFEERLNSDSRALRNSKFLTEEEKENLPIKYRLELKLYDYITEEEYLSLSTIDKLENGLTQYITEEELNNLNIDDKIKYRLYDYIDEDFLVATKDDFKILSTENFRMIVKSLNNSSLKETQETKDFVKKVIDINEDILPYVIHNTYNSKNPQLTKYILGEFIDSKKVPYFIDLVPKDILTKIPYLTKAKCVCLHRFLTEEEIKTLSDDEILEYSIKDEVSKRFNNLTIKQKVTAYAKNLIDDENFNIDLSPLSFGEKLEILNIVSEDDIYKMPIFTDEELKMPYDNIDIEEDGTFQFKEGMEYYDKIELFSKITGIGEEGIEYYCDSDAAFESYTDRSSEEVNYIHYYFNDKVNSKLSELFKLYGYNYNYANMDEGDLNGLFKDFKIGINLEDLTYKILSEQTDKSFSNIHAIKSILPDCYRLKSYAEYSHDNNITFNDIIALKDEGFDINLKDIVDFDTLIDSIPSVYDYVKKYNEDMMNTTNDLGVEPELIPLDINPEEVEVDLSNILDEFIEEIDKKIEEIGSGDYTDMSNEIGRVNKKLKDIGFVKKYNGLLYEGDGVVVKINNIDYYEGTASIRRTSKRGVETGVVKLDRLFSMYINKNLFDDIIEESVITYMPKYILSRKNFKKQ